MPLTLHPVLSQKPTQSKATPNKNQRNPLPATHFGLSQDQVFFSKAAPRFSGRSLDAEKDRLQGLKGKKDTTETSYNKACSDLESVQKQIREIESNREDNIEKGGAVGLGTGASGGTVGGALGGGLAGAKAGLAIDAATGGLTLGLGTAIGTGIGALAGMLGGASGGALLGKKTGEVIVGGVSKEVPSDLLDKETGGKESRDTNKTNLDALISQISGLQVDLDNANGLYSGVKDTHRIAQNAIDITPFQDRHFFHLKNALGSDFDEILGQGKETRTEANKIPNFADRYKTLTGMPLGGRQAIPDILADLNSRDLQKQKLALLRLHAHDGMAQHKDKYVHVLREHQDSDVAGAALQMMAKHPELRPSDFNNDLLNILGGNRAPLIKVALETIETLQPQDPRIDNSLRQLSHDSGRIRDKQIRDKATSLLAIRSKNKLTVAQDSRSIAGRTFEKLLGNRANQAKLKVLLDNYHNALNNPYHKGPVLKIYMPGEGGIGKTTVAANLQKALFQNPNDIIVIRPDELNELEGDKNLAALLKSKTRANASGVHDLDNRVILIDEFQGVDTIDSVPVRKKFLEDMKKLFAINTTDIDHAQTWLASQGIQMRHPVFVVASNADFPDLEIAKKGNPANVQYKALASRMDEVIEEDSPHRFDLNADLSSHLPEFLSNFGPQRYFETVENRMFDGPIHFTNSAKQNLTEKVEQKKRRMGGEIAGRPLAETLTTQINGAINRSEASNSHPFLRNGALGKIKESLIIDRDASGNLIARAGSL